MTILTVTTKTKMPNDTTFSFKNVNAVNGHSSRLSSALPYILACICICLMIMPSAYAHQQKLALTKIVVNERSAKLEVMHRFELHDAEHAVKEIFDGDADIIQSQDTQAKFAQYVFERFGIFDADGNELVLNPIGYEIEGKHFWVYEEAELPAKLDGLQVVHNALRDIWFAQTNTVNIEAAGEVSTLTFTDNTEVLHIDHSH